MRWMRRAVLAVLALVLLLGALLVATALRSERPVGFQLVPVADADGRPFVVGLWYPTRTRAWPTSLLGPMLMQVARDAPVEGSALPLILLSHGNGAGLPSHADLALALADAGYVVAAPLHPGDNFADDRAVGSATLFSGRNRQLRLTLDHVLQKWSGRDQLDASRVGAFGFSAGGLTVLTAIGAQPDLRQLALHCAQAGEFVCAVLRHHRSPLLSAEAQGAAGDFQADPRIRAAVLAAPGLGFTLNAERLAAVQVPVQLWSAEQDDKVPYASNARRLREGLGARAEFHSVAGAGHHAFLLPCPLLKAPEFCKDPEGFDRAAFHARMNAEVVAFFGRQLPAR